MAQKQSYTFNALIYKTGINYCVDVPGDITAQLQKVKGYIRIKGTVNRIYFTKSLVPVKDGLYRLYINTITMKGIREMVGEVAELIIAQDTSDPEQEHPASPELLQRLTDEKLLHVFYALSASRRKEILRYLNNLKTPQTLEKQTERLVAQLRSGAPGETRIP